MQVLMLENANGPTGLLLKDSSYTLSDAQALELIGMGRAKVTTPITATAGTAMGALRPYDPLLGVTAGNSISTNGSWIAGVQGGANGGWQSSSEAGQTNKHFPLVWNPKRMAAVSANAGATTVDVYGNYGYSGVDSNTIIADWATNWFPNLDAAGIQPRLVSLVDMFANDIFHDASLATVQARALAGIEALRSKWPNAIVELNTPHPDDRNTTASRRSVFNSLSDWLIGSVHDGINVLVTDLRLQGGYADPRDPSLPLAGFYGTNVHPNQAGASRNARLMAATRRAAFGAMPALGKPLKSPALGMLGTAAVAVTGFSGTKPTGWAAPTPLSVAGECVCAAANPGAWNILWTPTSIATACTLQLSITTGLPTGDLMGWAKVRINSGAGSIGALTCNFQQQTAGGATKNYNFRDVGTASQECYQDGDVLYLMTPSLVNAGTLTGIYPTIYIRPLVVGVAINVDILAAGYLDLA